MSLHTHFDHYNVPVGPDHSPHAFFEELRDEAIETETPIGWSEEHGGFWVVTGWPESPEIMHNNEDFSNRGITVPPYGTPDDTPIMLAGMDEPDHRKYRRIIQTPFSQRNAAALDQELRAATNDLIDQFIDRGRVDLVAGLTRVFASEHLSNNTPIHVIQALLGHASPDTVMIYAKLYPGTLVEEYRKTVRATYLDFHGPDSLRNPGRERVAALQPDARAARHGHPSLRAARRRALLPRPGLSRLRLRAAQAQRHADLPAHAWQPPDCASAGARPSRARRPAAGQLAARELEIQRISSALRRAGDLDDDVAAAIEAA